MNLIEKHPILEFKRGRKVQFFFDGREMEGFEGEPIAAALHANGVRGRENRKRPWRQIKGRFLDVDR